MKEIKDLLVELHYSFKVPDNPKNNPFIAAAINANKRKREQIASAIERCEMIEEFLNILEVDTDIPL